MDVIIISQLAKILDFAVKLLTAQKGGYFLIRLVCGQDPVALGIATRDGQYDHVKFREHVEACPQCREFAGALTAAVSAELEDSVSAAQAAEMLGCTLSNVRKLRLAGKLHGEKFGRDWRYWAHDLKPLREEGALGRPRVGRLNNMSGWQEHPSTRIRHFFETGTEWSVCGRDRRTDATLHVNGGVFPCSFCRRKLASNIVKMGERGIDAMFHAAMEAEIEKRG